MHAVLHYNLIMNEYDFSAHCNVLIDENKHQFFKLIVYFINHLNVKKTILLRENFNQTIQLLLMNEFAHFEFETTQFIHDIYNNCFSLFNILLPRFEQMQLQKNDLKSRVSII